MEYLHKARNISKTQRDPEQPGPRIVLRGIACGCAASKPDDAICRAALEQHVAASDQAAFEGRFRTACGQAIFENWGRDDAVTQAALDLLDFGNDLLQSAGPSKLPAALLSNPPGPSSTGPVTSMPNDQPAAQHSQPSHLPMQQHIQQPTAFWRGPAGPEMAKYLTLPALPKDDRNRLAARPRAKPQPAADQPSKGGVKRKKSAESAPAKKQRTAGKKTLAKGLPRDVQKHFAVFLGCMDGAGSPTSSWQVIVVFSSAFHSTCHPGPGTHNDNSNPAFAFILLWTKDGRFASSNLAHSAALQLCCAPILLGHVPSCGSTCLGTTSPSLVSRQQRPEHFQASLWTDIQAFCCTEALVHTTL